jgi:phage protein D
MPAPLIQLLLDGAPVDPRVLDRITRMEVRESDEDPSMAAVRLQLSQQPGGTFSPLDDELFVAGARLGVEVASPGGLPQRLFDGIVTHVRPHFETIEANCYLEVLAMDDAVVLDAYERTASYPDASDADAVGDILARYNITAAVEQTPEQHKADERLLVQRSTDWQFIRHLARRNGYVSYFEYDDDADEVVCHFERRAVTATPQADLTILQSDANLKWLDLEWIVTGPVRVEGAAIDAIRKRIVSTDGTPALADLGESGLPDAIEQGLIDAGAIDGAVRLVRNGRATDEGIQAEGTARTDEARLAIEARGEIDPRLYRGLLRARRPVLVKGAGSRMSGLFYVRTVRTSIDDGQIAQTFIAERNALGQSGQEQFGQTAEEVPAQ